MSPYTQGLSQNRSDAELYIETLTGSANNAVTFQTFGDGAEASGYPRKLHGTLDQHWDQLVALNNSGHGIFMMVNEGDLTGRKAENVCSLRALFIDDDGKHTAVRFSEADAGPFTGPLPSITVESRAGQHNYFLLFGDEPLAEFAPAQKVIAHYFRTDPAVHDLPRVMRVPGFFHMKVPHDPYLVKVVQTSKRRYGIKDVIAAYSLSVSHVFDEEKLRGARAYVAQVPPAIERQQGDKATFGLCCILGRGFDLNDVEALEVLRSWNAACQPPWSESELTEKLKNARAYGTEEIGCRIRKTNSAAATAPTTSLAYLVPQEQFVYRHPEGSWDLSSPVGEASARAHLAAMRIPHKQAGQIVTKKLCVIAYGTVCKPNDGPVCQDGERSYLNSYVAPKIEPRAFPWPTIDRLLSTVTAGDQLGRDWVFNWMSFKAQNPGARNMTALVLQGLHGTGKSLLGVILSNIIGPENCATIGQRDLENSFNEPYVGKLLVLADEVVNRDNLIETSSKLKQMITDPKIMMNGKHKTQRQIDNRMTWIFTSNSPTPVKVEGATDRRYTVFSNHRPAPPDYDLQLRSLFDAAGQPTAEFLREMQGFALALRDHAVDQLQVKRPYQNAAREALAVAGMSAAELFFAEVLERGAVAVIQEFVQGPVSEWDLGDRGLLAGAVYEAYRAFCSQGGFTPLHKGNFGKELHQRNPEWKRERLPNGKKRLYVYVGLPRGGRAGTDSDRPTEPVAA